MNSQPNGKHLQHLLAHLEHLKQRLPALEAEIRSLKKEMPRLQREHEAAKDEVERLRYGPLIPGRVLKVLKQGRVAISVTNALPAIVHSSGIIQDAIQPGQPVGLLPRSLAVVEAGVPEVLMTEKDVLPPMDFTRLEIYQWVVDQLNQIALPDQNMQLLREKIQVKMGEVQKSMIHHWG